MSLLELSCGNCRRVTSLQYLRDGPPPKRCSCGAAFIMPKDLRDEFAIAALAGISGEEKAAEQVAAWAYEIADAMLQKRAE